VRFFLFLGLILNGCDQFYAGDGVKPKFMENSNVAVTSRCSIDAAELRRNGDAGSYAGYVGGWIASDGLDISPSEIYVSVDDGVDLKYFIAKSFQSDDLVKAFNSPGLNNARFNSNFNMKGAAVTVGVVANVGGVPVVCDKSKKLDASIVQGN